MIDKKSERNRKFDIYASFYLRDIKYSVFLFDSDGTPPLKKTNIYCILLSIRRCVYLNNKIYVWEHIIFRMRHDKAHRISINRTTVSPSNYVLVYVCVCIHNKQVPMYYTYTYIHKRLIYILYTYLDKHTHTIYTINVLLHHL